MDSARITDSRRLAHPAFAGLAPLLDAGIDALTMERLNALAGAADPSPRSGTGAPIRFDVARVRSSALEYESRILAEGIVATRPGAIHDVFNALCWIAFPRIKRACNALHVARAGSSPGVRGAKRDALTLFDESGVIALCLDARLGEMLRRRQWKTLFVDWRVAAMAGIRFFVCGHALFEKLLAPYPGITGRVLTIDVHAAAFDSGLAAQRAMADETGAELLRQVDTPAKIPPLPLCGIPGWDPGNDHPSFYDDPAIFRASRSIASGSASLEAQSAEAPASSSSSVDP